MRLSSKLLRVFVCGPFNYLDRPRPLVAGSIGPYGAYQHDGSEYTGNYVDNMTVEVILALLPWV